MKKTISLICLLMIFIGCTMNTSDSKKEVVFHKTHEPKKSKAPFSDIVQVGDLYFLSGQIGMDHSVRELVEGGIKVETKQALENIKDVLKHHNMDMENVVKCTVILSDINDFSAFNEIYKDYFPHKPARTTFAAKGLAKDAKIEIECVAVKKK
ncbi:RidA family protein [Aquimarina aquimarini]|uniref:RidA family protein n=1 Tax=Aquimarina aquimarini TaxID=1191734 RepID=UPI000D54C8C0|nr:Rid family detoxifying hydrolase [Aquimarina aquimarini]